MHADKQKASVYTPSPLYVRSAFAVHTARLAPHLARQLQAVFRFNRGEGDQVGPGIVLLPSSHVGTCVCGNKSERGQERMVEN
jgi:hypothetical protein